MATTYSENYQIKLIGTGLEAGTWGRSTNLNFERIEEALGGSTTITIDGATIPNGSTYSSNVFSLMTNSLVDAGDSGSEGRNRFIKITNGSAITASQTIRFFGSDVSSDTADRIFIVENALDLSSSDDQYGTLTLRSGAGSTGISLPHGSIAFVYTSGVNLYNALEQLFISSLDMSGGDSDIIVNDGSANSFEIKDNRLNASNEFERDTYVRIGTDSTPSVDIFPSINSTDLPGSSFSVNSDTNTFGTDTFGTLPHIKGNGIRGLQIRGGSTGSFSTVTTRHGTNANVELGTQGTGKILVGQSSGDITIESVGNNNITLQTGNSDTGSISIEDGANGNISLAPDGGSGNITLDIENSAPVGSATNGVLIPNNGHLNFGTTAGNSGNGVRSNSGELEVSVNAVDGWGYPYHSGAVSGQGAFYDSGEIAIPTGSSATLLTTGFNSIPSIVTVYLKRTAASAGAGYNQNDYALYSAGYSSSGGGAGLSVSFDGTSGSDLKIGCSGSLYIANKNTGLGVAITKSNWRIVVKAWK